MLKILLWVAIIILIALIAKRIGHGLLVFGVMIGAIFLSIFMLDTFTTFNARNYVPIGFYDKTVDDPKEVAESLKEKVVGEVELGKGKEVVDKINGIGDTVDKKYGTEIQKDKSEDKDEKDKSKVEDGEKETNKEQKKHITNLVEGEKFVKYKDVKDYVKENGTKFTEKEESILTTIVPMLVMDYEGDNYRIWNVRGEDGVHITPLTDK